MNEQTLNMLNTFKAFMADDKADSMYVTGAAGTGKTTDLAYLVDYCLASDTKTVVCAYTHKAVSVLRSKMPKKTDMRTLHAFLRKRPTINVQATKAMHIDSNMQMEKPETVKVIFIDEFSMVGEKDYVDIIDMQFDEDTADLITKVVYLGDLNQLPPVKDIHTIKPSGEYCVNLTKVYRQADDNPLLDTLIALTKYIGGEPAKPLLEHKTFKRGVNIVNEYTTDCVLLAYTNKRVQELNAKVMGRHAPIMADDIYSPTFREKFKFRELNTNPISVRTISGDLLELDSKYKTLETLIKLKDIQFFDVEDEEGYDQTLACVFGHQSYIDIRNKLADEATRYNRLIEKQYGMKAALWCKHNSKDELAKKRAKGWSNFLSFNSNVVCIDFSHAMTVHKSQGSTFKTVLLDLEDLGKCAKTNYKLYLKLVYVAISRASERVYTN